MNNNNNNNKTNNNNNNNNRGASVPGACAARIAGSTETAASYDVIYDYMLYIYIYIRTCIHTVYMYI